LCEALYFINLIASVFVNCSMELDFLRQAQYKLLEGGEKFDVSSLDKVYFII